jgi:uncharacterized circularly permuted ATP-grasp superfamily protein/uncharacterized alpha-E superfamily protein
LQNIDTVTDTIGAQYYQTQLGSYDEMLTTENRALPHWERLMVALELMGGDKLESRRREAQRLLQENGVTYNVYGDSQKLARPWQLDPVPLLISKDEWQGFENGLKQRARLLNLILNDIYAQQALLKKGLLPFELIFGHEGFLQSCVGTLKHNRQQLIFYAANLARGPNGLMWVLDDRVQAPSGAGYALENRTVMTRIMPDLFRDTQVCRLSGFFKALYHGLAEIAPHNKDEPRIVILTPGPFNETYFEHAYLAACLGITLAQGDDLTVRDGRVWLKTLSGLLPIDVILRRVDDSFCDPLELLNISKLGVPGLLEVVRRGNVAVANPLGGSVLENPGLLAFLPGLARYFLNEDLILPSVATWWCGQQRERDFVLQNLENLVIKPINRSQGYHAVFPGLMANREKADLRAMIKAKPHLFVGQEQVSFSTLPAFLNNHIEPRNAILRTFLVANDNDYTVMPGGLTRIAAQKNNYVVSNQSGGISKDTWVLAANVDAVTPTWVRPARNQASDSVIEPLTSRAADNLFWVGRYIERIEASTRILRTVLQKLRETFEYQDSAGQEALKTLLPALTHITGCYPGFINCDAKLLASPMSEILAVATEVKRTGSLAANIWAFKQSAYNIRDLWSQDTWRCIDHIQQQAQQWVSNKQLNAEQLYNHLDDLITGLVAFSGITSESMSREATWLMLDSGRRLERALALIALLRATLIVQFDDALQYQLFESLLTSTDSLASYQRRYRSFIQLPRILELLLLDENHPRSLSYQLCQITKHLESLRRNSGGSQLGQEQRLLLKAHTDLRLCDLNELAQYSSSHYNAGLDELLTKTAEGLSRLSEVISENYFSHLQASQRVAPVTSGEEP